MRACAIANEGGGAGESLDRNSSYVSWTRMVGQLGMCTVFISHPSIPAMIGSDGSSVMRRMSHVDRRDEQWRRCIYGYLREIVPIPTIEQPASVVEWRGFTLFPDHQIEDALPAGSSPPVVDDRQPPMAVNECHQIF